MESELERLADSIAARYFARGPEAVRPQKLAGLG